MSQNLIRFTGNSLYCAQADVHIDPWIGVDRAIITHAHSDHAKWGSKNYLAHKDSAPILRMRLGNDINLQTVEYGEIFTINGVRFSLHPAGHIIGSAQVRMEYKGDVWVASGDYKLEDDHFCAPYEPVKCNTFITESTFGLPIYNWRPQEEIFNEIHNWYERNRLEGKTSVLMGYALGKMQRIITGLRIPEEQLFAHGAVRAVNEQLRNAGYRLPYLQPVTNDKKQHKGCLVLAPAGADGSTWIKRFEPYSTGYCSGWMAVRGAKNRRALDQGFAMSDHADWKDLNRAIRENGAEKVFVTHGYTNTFARWLNENGIAAAEVKTLYGTETEEQDTALLTPETEEGNDKTS